jgi:hypothetical protein
MKSQPGFEVVEQAPAMFYGLKSRLTDYPSEFERILRMYIGTYVDLRS